VISTAENSNKFQKTRFWKEKSIEDVLTLGPTGTGHTNILESFYILGYLLQLIIKIWQIWAIFFFHENPFVLVEIIFFSTKLGENLPVKETVSLLSYLS
jgi:hypothetical protein